MSDILEDIKAVTIDPEDYWKVTPLIVSPDVYKVLQEMRDNGQN